MRQLGIIAAEDERIIPNPKWYQFWKKKADFELIGIDDANLELVVVYLPENKKDTSDWMEKTNALFQSKGIYHIAETKKARQKSQMQYHDLKLHTGRELMIYLFPKLLRKIAKIRNINLQQATAAYIDEHFSAMAEQVLQAVSKEVRYIVLVTKNKSSAAQIGISIYEEFGMPIDLFEGEDAQLSCHFAIWMDGPLPKMPKDAILINLQENQHNKGITCQSFELSLEGKIIDELPFAFYRNEIIQALWTIGVIEQAALDNAKIKRISLHEEG